MTLIRCAHNSLATMNRIASKIILTVSLSRLQTANTNISLKNNSVATEFQTLKTADVTYLYENGKLITRAKIELVALFSGTKLCQFSGKHLEKVNILQTKSLMLILR